MFVFISLVALREVNTKITLLWALKQFVTYIILYLFYVECNYSSIT